MALVTVAFSAYAMNLFIFYSLAAILPEAQVFASFIGFAIAFGFDNMGSKTHALRHDARESGLPKGDSCGCIRSTYNAIRTDLDESKLNV